MLRTKFLNRVASYAITAVFIGLLPSLLQAQCEVWVNSETEQDAKDNHVLYKDALKVKNYEQAYSYWKKAYELAPAADGKRDDHFLDGAEILKKRYAAAGSEEEKKQIADQIIALYEQAAECLEQGAIEVSVMSRDERIGFIRGREAFDMFYHLRTPYTRVKKALDASIDKIGNKAEYIILDPYAHVMVFLFTNDLIEAEEVREKHALLNEIAEYNIANNQDYKAQYKQAQDAMNSTMEKIEQAVYDCDYFKGKFQPQFKESPRDYKLIENMIRKLKQQGCDSTDVFLNQLQDVYRVYVDSINAVKQAEFEANNPGYVARKLYEEGKYNEAVEKYKEAIDKAEDNDQKAEYYFGIASIQFRKQNKYATARTTALKAAELKPGWGRPYMLIGDMYGSSARSCGDSWNQRLAVLAAIEKYRYARSIDSSVAEEANKRIGQYASSKPDEEEGFMQNLKEGQKVKVKCWIGETVTLDYK